MSSMDMSPEGIQKMMLTPKMLLSIHVLQLNIMDLKIFMRAELEENPLLEEEELLELNPDDDKEIKLEEELSRLVDGDSQENSLFAGLGNDDNAAGEEKKNYLQSLITSKESLYEHLYWQLQVLARNEEEKRIGDFIIGNLDNNGFLTMELDRMRKMIGADVDSFRHALTLVRSFDPVGVGARDIKETLLIQLISSGKQDTHLYRITYSHLEDLGKGDFKKIAKALSISLEEVVAAKNRISYLNPKPGAAFSKEITVRIVPDVFLYKNEDEYDIQVNERDMPRLRTSSFYNKTLKNKNTPDATKEYIRKKLSHARWLIESVDQRKNTVKRICEHLVYIQNDFLENREHAAETLTLKRVADSLSISEATVSRAVSHKYLQTPQGTFLLKKFFARGIKQDSGEISTAKIKEKISELIEDEDIKKPLKDFEIQSILKDQGINISRRTVAKYRDSLKLLPSNIRKNKMANHKNIMHTHSRQHLGDYHES